MDIIETSEGSRTGYLAVDPIDYAHCLLNILYSTDEENETIRNAARFVIVKISNRIYKIYSIFDTNSYECSSFHRASCDRFSEEEFQKNFLRAVTLLFND